jgi:hypothetical protein
VVQESSLADFLRDDTNARANSQTVAESGEEGDLFGTSLAVGDFGNGAQADLSIGAPGDSITSFLRWQWDTELGAPIPQSGQDLGVVRVIRSVPHLVWIHRQVVELLLSGGEVIDIR